MKSTWLFKKKNKGISFSHQEQITVKYPVKIQQIEIVPGLHAQFTMLPQLDKKKIAD